MTNRFLDAEFAQAFREKFGEGYSECWVIANKYRARVCVARPGEDWIEIGEGELGDLSIALLGQPKVRKVLRWQSVQSNDLASVAMDPASASPMRKKDLTAWAKERDKATLLGRTGEVDEKTRFKAASAAGWRCQMDGCGEELRDHFIPGSSGNNYGYFAHIVASSKDGPRGDEILSPMLANDPANIMLLCDKCHRLIDRVDPEYYSTPLLNEMRERNILEVKRLLDTLSYPEYQILVVQGGIQGQIPQFNARHADEAMWKQRVRGGSRHVEWFATQPRHLSNPHAPGYWASMFEVLRIDIPRLKGLLTGSSNGGAPLPPLAIFPAHTTSGTILTGRLVGDAASCKLFQFHRNQSSGVTQGGQWAWPEVDAPADGKYTHVVHRSFNPGDEEALLQINLTAAVPGSRLPSHLYRDGHYVLPTIELTVQNCSPACIRHPRDLELLGSAIDEALKIIQDEWRVKRVHLVPIAPLTANFRMGQKMQARHQAEFVLYELHKSSDGDQAFRPTIHISSNHVTLAENPTTQISIL